MGFFKDFFKVIPVNAPSPFEQIDDEIEAIPTSTPLPTETNPVVLGYFAKREQLFKKAIAIAQDCIDKTQDPQKKDLYEVRLSDYQKALAGVKSQIKKRQQDEQERQEKAERETKKREAKYALWRLSFVLWVV